MFDYSIIQIPKHICWYNYIKYTEVTPDPVYKMHGGAQWLLPRSAAGGGGYSTALPYSPPAMQLSATNAAAKRSALLIAALEWR